MLFATTRSLRQGCIFPVHEATRQLSWFQGLPALGHVPSLAAHLLSCHRHTLCTVTRGLLAAPTKAYADFITSVLVVSQDFRLWVSGEKLGDEIILGCSMVLRSGMGIDCTIPLRLFLDMKHDLRRQLPLGGGEMNFLLQAIDGPVAGGSSHYNDHLRALV